MRTIKALAILAAGAFAILGVVAAASTSGVNSAAIHTQSISPEERAARDQLARQELTAIQAKSTFKVLLPASLPTGYTYDRVMWDSSRPEFGFTVWFVGPDPSAPYGLQLIEAPYVPGAPKQTLQLPGLTPIPLQSGTWQMLQKADEPGKGLWILVTVQNGVQIEVDGEKAAAVAIAGQV